MYLHTVSFFIKKHDLGRCHVIIKQLVPFDDEFEIIGQVLQQLHHDTASPFESDSRIGIHESLQHILETFDGFVAKSSGKGFPVLLQG